MAELFGQAFWPGLRNGFIECSGTCSWGITPGTASLTIPVGPDGGVGLIAEVGDLTFSDGVNTVTWKDCKIVRSMGQIDSSGKRVTLLIQDRRWRWQDFGVISGSYNVPAERTSTIPKLPALGTNIDPSPPGLPQPAPEGEEAVKPWTKKRAGELADLCLAAMGETGANILALDQTATPSVEWDSTNPAYALNSLAESLGCVVTLNHATNTVVLCKRGEGKPMPEGSYTSDNPGFDAKVRPSALRLYGARVRYQVRFPLEAVGLDFDGSIKPIEQLSYCPARGRWTRAGPPGFADVVSLTGLPGGRTYRDARALARQSVFRMYRIMLGDNGDPNVQVYIPPRVSRAEQHAQSAIRIRRIQQVRLLPVKNVTTLDDLNREYLAPAACYGRHVPPFNAMVGEKLQFAWSATNATSEVICPFTIDEEHQTIVFARHIFGFDNGEFLPAEIVLECACEVRDPDTNQFVRFFRELPFPGGLDTKPAVIVNENVRYQVTAWYDYSDSEDSRNLQRNTDNRAAMNRRADYLLNGEAVRYLPAEAADRNFCGILPIDTDGAIQQVTWSVGGGTESNPSTRVSRNTEHATYLPAYEGRRRIEETMLSQVKRGPGAASFRTQIAGLPEVVPIIL